MEMQSIYKLFRDGYDTLEISHIKDMKECDIYNELAKRKWPISERNAVIEKKKRGGGNR